EPDQIETCMSATAEVRVKRGSTWMSSAPRSLACMTQRNATGLFSAMFEPMITMNMIPFVVEQRPAEREDPRRHVHQLAIRRATDKRRVPRLLAQFGHPIHSLLAVHRPPLGPARLAVEDLRQAVRVDVKLEKSCALGARVPTCQMGCAEGGTNPTDDRR